LLLRSAASLCLSATVYTLYEPIAEHPSLTPACASLIECNWGSKLDR